MSRIGYWSATSIGVGGMVGGGIFAVLGLAVQLAHGGVPVAFLLSGAVALMTSYAYARLSVTFPSQGGTVEFLNQAFGPGILTGGLNVLLWLSYVVMLALYAFAFGSYGQSFFPSHALVWKHVLISAVVVLLTVLNVAGTRAVGRAEVWIVAVKVTILLLFVVLGARTIEWTQLAPGQWTSPLSMFAGGMIIFLAYEGFELIANTARDVDNAKKTLPRAYFSAVGFVVVLYVLVAMVTAGNLSVSAIVEAKDYALAEAAKPFMGQAGFTLIAIAALLSTGSAINATLYGAARISYIIAKDGELPKVLEHKIWHRPVEGLLVTAALTLLAANVLDLSSISMMGSAGFLLVFAAVNAANARLADRTHSRRWISVVAAVGCLVALAALLVRVGTNEPAKLWVLGAMLALSFGIEWLYRAVAGREISSPVQSVSD